MRTPSNAKPENRAFTEANISPNKPLFPQDETYEVTRNQAITDLCCV